MSVCVEISSHSGVYWRGVATGARFLVLLAVLWPQARAEATPVDVGLNATLLGWSHDGQYLVWTSSLAEFSDAKKYYAKKGGKRVRVKKPELLPPAEAAALEVDKNDEESQEDETASIAVLHEVRSGAQKKFLLSYKAVSYEGITKGVLKQKCAGFADAAAWEAWKQAHPVVKTASRKGPNDGQVDITFKASGDDDFRQPKWKGDSITWDVANTVKVTLTTIRGKDRAQETIEQGMAAMYQPRWTATPFWDPTGRRVLFIFQEADAETQRGTDGGHIEYHVIACWPRVDVLAPAALNSAIGKVAAAVEKAGFTVSSTGAAKEARTKTVVYAKEGLEAQAAQIAAAIPGGATVEKLTWKPKAEVVVALGDSAR